MDPEIKQEHIDESHSNGKSISHTLAIENMMCRKHEQPYDYICKEEVCQQFICPSCIKDHFHDKDELTIYKINKTEFVSATKVLENISEDLE